MTNEEYFRLNSEISRTGTAADVERLRAEILTFPDDPDRKTLFRSLAQHAADTDIILTS